MEFMADTRQAQIHLLFEATAAGDIHSAHLHTDIFIIF
jgi:hypothetical protein